MTVKNVEKLEKSRVAVTVEVGAEEFEAAVAKAYAKARGKLSIPGFRPGKAPRKMIERMYGAEVFFEEAINIAFPEAYEAAAEQEKLQIVGYPTVEMVGEVTKDGFTFKATTPVYPEVTLGEYKGLKAEKPEVKVLAADVDERLKALADRNTRLVSVDREAKSGDTAVIDFEGFMDGKPFDGGKGENHNLELGSGSFVPGFEDQVIGMKAGEEKDLDITFPENYHADLAGKAVVFKVKVHEVKEKEVPAMDDEFAKDVSEYDTLAALKKSIKADLAKKRQEAVDRDFENEAVVLAGKNMTCDIPACMIDEQVDKHLEQFAYQLQSQGMKMEDYVKMIGGDVKGMRDSMRPMAEQTVRSNILLSEIVHQENIDVTDEEVEEELKKLAEQYKMELDKIREMIDVEAVKSDLKGRKAVKLIVDNAKPVEKEKEKKAAKKSAKKEDEAAEAPAEEAPKAEE